MIVQTRLGPIEGLEQGAVAVFRNMPYAAPPVGELRFRASEPPHDWRFTRDGKVAGASAPQLQSMMRDLAPQDEDCLHANLWVPLTPGGALPSGLPVIVFIHGGGFVGGASTHPMYDGRELARRGQVVVVSFNYRLGALGFADFAALDGSGFAADANCGLHDQLQALRFVRDHIAAFGGDPERVTVMAQSAGAMSAATLLCAEPARGLFSRLILQSGAAHHVTTRTDSSRIAKRILDTLGIGADLGKLRGLPWAAIVRAQALCLRERVEVGAEGRPLLSRGMTLLPLVDGELVRERPTAALAAGAGADVPVLIGTNRHEWNFWMFIAEATKRDLDERGVVDELRERAGERAPDLFEHYRAAMAADGGAREPFRILSAVETDCMFGVPALRFCEARAHARAPTFAYEFDWNGPLFEGQMGACHSLELPFVLGLTGEGFGQVFAGGGPRARRLSELMMDAWLAFAREAQPRAEALPAWPATGAAPSAIMALREAPALIEDPRRGRYAFWSALI